MSPSVPVNIISENFDLETQLACVRWLHDMHGFGISDSGLRCQFIDDVSNTWLLMVWCTAFRLERLHVVIEVPVFIRQHRVLIGSSQSDIDTDQVPITI